MSVKIKKQFTVWMENKPGRMARLGRAMRRGRVNILAISVVDSADSSQVRIVVSNATTARKALSEANLPVTVRDVLVLRLSNVPGAMGKIGTTLARAKINLDYAYGSTHPGVDDALVIVACDKIPKAARLLR